MYVCVFVYEKEITGDEEGGYRTGDRVSDREDDTTRSYTHLVSFWYFLIASCDAYSRVFLSSFNGLTVNLPVTFPKLSKHDCGFTNSFSVAEKNSCF